MSKREIKLKKLAAKWKSCKRCELSRERKNIVMWRGNPNARFMVIGEAPGAEEDKMGKPFVGESGNYFDKVCSAVSPVSSKQQPYFIANTVGCRPPKNRKPMLKEWCACSSRLYSMIATVKPEAILLLGGTALEFLTGFKKITAIRGEPLPLVFDWKGIEHKFEAIGTFHPSYLLRNRGNEKLERLFANDIRKTWLLSQGGSWITEG